MIGTESVPFWDTVVVNMAPIIIALTGFGAMIGGFWMQKRMMDKQNEKLDRNAERAANERDTLSSKIDSVKEATNGIAQRNEELARTIGKAEGKAEEKANPTP